MTKTREIAERYLFDKSLRWAGADRTFRARDWSTGKLVAVKALGLHNATPVTLDFLADFAARLLPLEHPNLARVLDFGITAAGDAFLVHEWVEGTSLDKATELPASRVLEYLLQVIEGLEALAREGLVHLNLKPDSLLQEHRGVKIVGVGSSPYLFGCKPPPPVAGSHSAADFAAPELESVSLVIDPGLWRADLYSVAALTCFFLGVHLERPSAGEPRIRIPPEAEAELNESAPLRETLASCLNNDPHTRPTSFRKLRDALQKALGQSGPPAGEVDLQQAPEGSSAEPAGGQEQRQPQLSQPLAQAPGTDGSDPSSAEE